MAMIHPHDTYQDSSTIVTQEDESGEAWSVLPDVQLKDGLRRVFNDKDISKLVYTTTQEGRKLMRKWYEHPLIGSAGASVSIAIAIKVYFF